MRELGVLLFFVLPPASLGAALVGNWPFAMWALMVCLLCIFIDMGRMLLRIVRLLDNVHTIGLTKLDPEDIERLMRFLRK